MLRGVYQIDSHLKNASKQTKLLEVMKQISSKKEPVQENEKMTMTNPQNILIRHLDIYIG